MQVKTIPSKWLHKEGLRFDCGPYMSGAIEARALLQELRYPKDNIEKLTIGGESGIINAGRIERIWVLDDEHGYPFLSSGDILQPDLSYSKFISKKIASKNKKLLINRDYTLITRSGTTGRTAYARPDMDGMTCTEDVMRIVPDATKIWPGYLYAFLICRFGVPLVLQGTYGAIIQHIEPSHIVGLGVPRLGDIEEQAHNLVQQAADLLCEYQHDINKATRMFFESVGLRDITAAEWHSWGADVGFSQTLTGPESLRALNFNPRFERLCSQIKEKSWEALINLCKPNTLKCGPRFKRIDADPEFAYRLIGQKQIFWLRPEGRWIARSSVGEEVLVSPGTIMVAAQGTLGESELYCRAEFIWGAAVNAAYSQHFLRIVADDEKMLPGCLFAFMRSETAFRMLRSIAMGSKLQDHHYTMLPQLPVPCPPNEVQEEIHQLITGAYEKREKAVELEDQARALVEHAIEEGGC